MKHLQLHNSVYTSVQKGVPLLSRIAPTFVFYWKFGRIVFQASSKAKRGLYTDDDWALDSFNILKLLEKMGVRVTISGLENLQKAGGPCVIIGNHMSIMETLLLPVIVQPFRKVTFVVKDSLLTYPVFKHIMQSRNPVAVTRTNPRQDFKTVMSEGVDRLGNGISIIVFPQTTRSHDFDLAHFGSIGIKLAKKAGVPVIPLALKTDAWQNGTYSKDFGKISSKIPVRFSFGEPLMVQGKGAGEHKQVADFISEKLTEWR
jgi:1-acyl-sn-glycerol-3-phosphate acyltransferase